MNIFNDQNKAILDYFLDGLMSRYQERVPYVGSIIKDMIKVGMIRRIDDIENDHIAFRTMGVKNLGVNSLEKIFLKVGYQRKDEYIFDKKKLKAYWYSPPVAKYPRIFISELLVDDLDQDSQRIIRSYTDEVKQDPVTQLNLDSGEDINEFLHKPLWRIPSLDDYQKLAAISEYASWVIYNRYYLNHFTISVHNLSEEFNTIDLFNQFLKKRGYKLNDSGGEIKVSDDGLLLQSSTVSNMIDAEFADDSGASVTSRISGSYVEFAERKILDSFASISLDKITREHRRDGFDIDNANNIFESTYSNQTNKLNQ